MTRPQAMLGVGQVRHARLSPHPHRFAYATYFLMLPMRSLRAAACEPLPRNRFGLVSFFDSDHGDGRVDSLGWIDELLAAEGVSDAQGEVWLQCLPRVVGFTFKPVSFWYCHRVDGSLSAVVAEVNNTFGERHCYLLCGPDVGWGRELRTRKRFHVSPFCATAGEYRFRFTCRRSSAAAPSSILACVDHDAADGPVLQTSWYGSLEPLTVARLRAAFFGMPLLTLSVVARIHWQALKLFAKRLPWRPKPAAPRHFVSR
jgi:uncharacterized protein